MIKSPIQYLYNAPENKLIKYNPNNKCDQWHSCKLNSPAHGSRAWILVSRNTDYYLNRIIRQSDGIFKDVLKVLNQPDAASPEKIKYIEIDKEHANLLLAYVDIKNMPSACRIVGLTKVTTTHSALSVFSDGCPVVIYGRRIRDNYYFGYWLVKYNNKSKAYRYRFSLDDIRDLEVREITPLTISQYYLHTMYVPFGGHYLIDLDIN